MTLRMGSLFSGIGGLDLGLERAFGARTAWACEADPTCQEVIEARWPSVPVHPDVRELHAADTPSVDVICGGFPCQDVSCAGTGAGLAGARSGLWFEMARVVREVRPALVVIENVRALLTRGLDRVLADLDDAGYDAAWCVIRASDVGASHQRARVMISALRRGATLPPCSAHVEPICSRWPAPPGPQHDWEPPRLTNQKAGRRDRLKALGNAVVPDVALAAGLVARIVWGGESLEMPAAWPGAGKLDATAAWLARVRCANHPPDVVRRGAGWTTTQPQMFKADPLESRMPVVGVMVRGRIVGRDEEFSSATSSGWPTPCAVEHLHSGRLDGVEAKRHTPRLAVQVQPQWIHWATPRNEDGESNGPSFARRHKRPDQLNRQVAWPGPRQSDQNGPAAHGDGAADLRTAVMWPTPDAQVFNDGQSAEVWAARHERERAKCYNGNGGGTPLAAAVLVPGWPTPTQGDGKSSGSRVGNPSTAAHPGTSLCDATERATWATPQAHDERGARSTASAERNGSRCLNRDVAPWCGDCGMLLAECAHTKPPTQRLNPDWVEALMGLPVGWTRLDKPGASDG